MSLTPDRANSGTAALPSSRIAFELARVDIRRGVRWVAAQDFWILYGLVSVLGIAFLSWRAFLFGEDAGAALAAGDTTWFLSGGAATIWGVIWLFMTGLLALDAIGSNGDVPNEGHYLTMRPARDVAAGKLLAAACKFSVFVFIPACAAYLGVAIGRGTPTPLIGGFAAAAVTVVSATAVGYPIGLTVKGVVRRSEILTRAKPVLALGLVVVYILVITTVEYIAVIDRFQSFLRASPLGWLADLSLVTTPGVEASSVGAIGALVAGTAIVAFGMLIAVPAARYAWGTDREPSVDDTAGDVIAPDHRIDEILGVVTRASPTRAIASTTLLRAYRSPLQLVFVAAPLIAAIPMGEQLLASGNPWYAPWFVLWYGAWAAGAAVPLNPLGNQGATLPSLLTAPATGRQVVHGHIVAAALPAVPVTAGLAIALGIVDGRIGSELAVIGSAAIATVIAASILAAGIGSVFPRFDAVSFGAARQAVPPSKVAYSVFSTILTLAVAAVAVILDDLARDIGVFLLSRWLPLGLQVSPGQLTILAWVIVAAVVLAVPVAYQVAIHRVDGYHQS